MNRKIVFNALVLYLRQIIVIIITLYTSRVVLLELGIESFGVYNLMAGVVALFSFLSSAISMSCQKIFSQQIEQKDWQGLKTSYSTIILLFFIIILFVGMLSYFLGGWYIKEVMVYSEKLDSSIEVIFSVVILSGLITLATTPFQAILVSNEKINIYSTISIFETFLKLVAAIILTRVTENKLEIFTVLNFLSALLVLIIYYIYIRSKYSYCRITKKINILDFINVIKFLGWNIYGSLTYVIRIQGVNLLLNNYFGPIANAARAISLQVFNTVNGFAMNISLAFIPSIMRGGLCKDNDYSKLLLYKTTMIIFTIMFIIALPLMLEMEFILRAWLISPPEYTIKLTSFILIEGLLTALSSQILVSVQSTGDIKKYQFFVGSLLLLNLPMSYYLLDNGYGIYSVMYVAVAISFVSIFIKVYFANKVLSYDISDIYIKVFLPILYVVSFSTIFTYGIERLLNDTIWSVIILTIFSTTLIITLSFKFYLDRNEKKIVVNLISSKLNRVRGG